MRTRCRSLLLFSIVVTLGALALAGCGSSKAVVNNPGGGNNNGSGSIAPAPASVLALLSDQQRSATYVGESTCLGCHLAPLTVGRGRSFAPQFDAAEWHQSHMAKAGVGCEQCHGPGSKHAVSPALENILAPPGNITSAVCQDCHKQQFDQWAASKHHEVVEEVKDEVVATPTARRGCAHCHLDEWRNTMITLPVEFGSTADQIDAGITGSTDATIKPLAQASDATAPCVECHNPHYLTGNKDRDGEDHQLRRATTNTDLSTVGKPSQPGKLIWTYNQVCANCHFGGSSATIDGTDAKLQASTSRWSFHENPQFALLMGFGGVEPAGLTTKNTAHASAPDQCAHCHMGPDDNHTMEAEPANCAPCHTPDEAQQKMTNEQAKVKQQLADQLSRMQKWAQAKFGDKELWEFTALIPTGHTAPDQKQVPIEVRRARHNYHLVEKDLSFGVHNPVYVDALFQASNANLDKAGAPAP